VFILVFMAVPAARTLVFTVAISAEGTARPSEILAALAG